MEFCMELYTHDAEGDLAILKISHPGIDDDLTILQVEVVAVVKTLRNWKSTGANNITAGMIKAGGEHVFNALTIIFLLLKNKQ